MNFKDYGKSILIGLFCFNFISIVEAKTPTAINVDDYPNIEVTLTDNKKLPCTLEIISKVYICKKDKTPLLLKNTKSGFIGITKDSKNSSIMASIKKISSNSKVIFESNIAAELNPSRPKTLLKIVEEKKLLISSFFNLENANPKGSEVFEMHKKDFINENSKLDNIIYEITYDEKFKVTLKDGEKLNCKRQSTRDVDEKTILSFEKMGIEAQCTAFHCGKISEGGSSYDVLLVFDSNLRKESEPSIFYVSKDKLIPKTIKNLLSASIEFPLVDNSHLNSTTTQDEDPYIKSLKSMFSNKLPENFKNEYGPLKNPTLTKLMEVNRVFCNDEESHLANFKNNKDNLLKSFAEMELAQLISVLSDGSLIGNYVDPLKAYSLGCMYGGVYLDEQAAQNLNLIKKNIRPDLKVDQTITMEKATELFNRAAAMQDLAWSFKIDGCYARAHLLARRFEAEGVRVDKVWMKGDMFLPEADFKWDFHVAPIVYVKDDKNQIQKIVIDPSLFDRPVSVEEWDSRMTKNTAASSVITTFPFPENSAFMEKTTISFSSSDPYLPKDNILMSEEAKMKNATDKMKEYYDLVQDNLQW